MGIEVTAKVLKKKDDARVDMLWIIFLTRPE